MRNFFLALVTFLAMPGVSALQLPSRAVARAGNPRMQFSFGSLFGGSKNSATTPKANSNSLAIPADVFDEELSAWPAILEIQESLASKSPEEQRRLKLEVGTNWPPRTSTAAPFDVEREGYMFFQGPTPLTSVQDGLPSFFSSENFSDLDVPLTLKIVGGVGAASFLAVAAVLTTA